jgi:hypothetical protein
MSFRPLIAKWPSKAAMAHDVGTTQKVVQAWWNRDSIPAQWYPTIARAADRRLIRGVSEKALVLAAAKRRPVRERA